MNLNILTPRPTEPLFGKRKAGSTPRWRQALASVGVLPFIGLPVLPQQGPLDSYCAPIMPSGDVSSIDDLPEGMPTDNHLIFDLSENPIFSEEACRTVGQLLQDAYDQGLFAMKVVVVDNFDGENPQAFNQKIINWLELSTPGDVKRGDSLLIERTGFLKGEASTIHNEPTNGPIASALDGFKINGVTYHDSIGNNVMAVYRPKIKEAHNNGDTARVQALMSEAIGEFVRTTEEYVSEYDAQNTPQAIAAREQAEAERRQRDREILIGLAKLLVELIAGIGVLGTVLFVSNRVYLIVQDTRAKNRSIDEDVDLVKQPLIQIQSPYKVTRNNVYSVDTLKALLEPRANMNGEHASADSLMKAIHMVLRSLEASDVPVSDRDIAELMIEKGLHHPVPEVRLATINVLVSDGLDRDEDWEPFTNLLEREQDGEVIEALCNPLLRLATEEDNERFLGLLQTSPNPGLRALGIRALAAHGGRGIIHEFFQALEKEDFEPNVEQLQEAIAHVATHADTGLLTQKLNSGDPTAKKAALEAFSELRDPDDFETIFSAFTQPNEPTLLVQFQEALTNSANQSHVKQIATGLTHASPRVQEVSLRLLLELADPDAVGAILTYLQAEKTPLPDLAAQALLASVNKKSREALLAVLKDTTPATEDVEVMIPVVEALKKIGDPRDLDDLTEAINKSHSPRVYDALVDAMEANDESPDSFEFLERTLLGHPDSRIRIAAALTIDNYGLKALPILFEALEPVSDGTPDVEINTLQRAINKAGNHREALPLLIEKASSPNRLVQSTAESLAVDLIGGYRDEKYTDQDVLDELDSYLESPNAAVRDAAEQAYTEIVDQEAKRIKKLGSSGKYSKSSNNYKYVKNMENDANEAIREAAQKARRKMDERREVANRPVIVYTPSPSRHSSPSHRHSDSWGSSDSSDNSSSWSSSFGGGFSGGGGFSSGGHGSSW